MTMIADRAPARVALAFLALAAGWSAAQAQTSPTKRIGKAAQAAQESADLMDGSDLEAVLTEMRDLGYQAKTVKLSDGATAIDSAASGVKFRVSFYSCESADAPCSIDFGASWLTSKNVVSLAKINEWNSKYRFGKAYNDKDGDLVFRMYVTLTSGVTRKNFRANFERWVSILAEFDGFRRKG